MIEQERLDFLPLYARRKNALKDDMTSALRMSPEVSASRESRRDWIIERDSRFPTRDPMCLTEYLDGSHRHGFRVMQL